MAVTVIGVMPGTKQPFQPIFREYYERKMSEGKTPSQALVCIMRRLVNIVYGMMNIKLSQSLLKHLGKKKRESEEMFSDHT